MKIKQFVHSEFASCTVLTIAHRLNTILDCDRIMVFEAGRLVEFDSPKQLLNNPNGFLTSLVNDTNAVHAQ